MTSRHVQVKHNQTIEPLSFGHKTTAVSGHFPASLIQANHGYHHLGYHDDNMTMETYLNQVNMIDHSVNKLFESMSIAYNNNSVQLTAPQFRAFKGFDRITVKEKMRLNNIVWREWHLQCNGNSSKYMCIRIQSFCHQLQGEDIRRRMRNRRKICGFAPQMEGIHTNPSVIILEGKYWKRSSKVVITEYRKWRVFYKERMKHWVSDGIDEISVDELLARVGRQDQSSISSFIRNQNIRAHNSPPDFTQDDFKMDMSDDIFSTLNSIGFPHGNNFHGLENSDFMQPPLLGLEPEFDLDDLSQGETLQDLLCDMTFQLKSAQKRSVPAFADHIVWSSSEFSTPAVSAYPAHKRSRSSADQPSNQTADQLFDQILANPTSTSQNLLQTSIAQMPVMSKQNDLFGVNTVSTNADHLTTLNNLNVGTVPSVTRANLTNFVLDSLSSVTQTTQNDFDASFMPLSAENNFHLLENSVQTSSHSTGNLVADQNPFLSSAQLELSSPQLNQSVQTTQVAPRTTHGYTQLSQMPQITNTGMSASQNNNYGHMSSAVRCTMARNGSTVSPSLQGSRHSPLEQYNQQPAYSTKLPVTYSQFSSSSVNTNAFDNSSTVNAIMDGEFRRPEPPCSKPSAGLSSNTSDSKSFLTQLLSSGNQNIIQSGPSTITRVKAEASSSSSNVAKVIRPVYFPPFTPIAYNPEKKNNAGGSNGFPFPGPADTSSPSEDDRRGDGQSAEQKRRQQIKSGFELLAELIPTIPTNTTSKTSKANVLVKTIEFITKLDDEKGEMEKEMDVLSQEIEALNDAITQCQSKLPATGLPAVSQQKEHLDQMLQVYIQDQTARDWRFYVFSKLVSPLFESYCKTVSTANTDELGRTSQAWLDQHCDLSNLRPVVVKSLQQLCSETSILTDPALFPEEAQGSAAPPAYNQRPKPEKTWQFG